MSSITNTNISSYDYLLRQCYSSNRNARKAFARSTMNAIDLLDADSSALKKAAKNLRGMEYSSENGVNIYNNIKAFVESYNNLSDSSDKYNASDELTRAQKKLKNLIKDNKDALEDIGIKVSSSGKLTVDKETLLTTSASKVGKVFSDKNEFSSNFVKHVTRIGRITKNLIHTGNSQMNKKSDSGNTIGNLPVTTASMTSNAIDFKA